MRNINISVMNIWVKSLLIGALSGGLVYFFSGKLRRMNRENNYEAQYTIRVQPDPDPVQPFSLSRIAETLEQRLIEADIRHQVKIIGKQLLRVTLYDLTDTMTSLSWLVSNGHLQFWELYTMDQVPEMLEAVQQELTPPEHKTGTSKEPVKTKGITEDVNRLLDSMSRYVTEEAGENSTKLIEFSTRFINADGLNAMPSTIGTVKIKDTFTVRQLLESPSIKSKGPADLQLCFGEPESYKRVTQQSPLLLYFLKTYGRPEKAFLENEDVKEASPDFTEDGRPVVLLEFNAEGSRKWATLTRRNTGRYIAMMINGRVISAPKVESEITGGHSVISGSFSAQETRAFALALKSRKLPATLYLSQLIFTAQENPGEDFRKWLGSLISFVVCSALAYFIFNSLKSS